MALGQAKASAIPFTCRISQRDDLRLFAAAMGAARFQMHGDLLFGNCHLPTKNVMLAVAVVFSEGDGVKSGAAIAFPQLVLMVGEIILAYIR
jgi:hypothetical protein